jgi:phenylacetate-CoA ligase
MSIDTASTGPTTAAAIRDRQFHAMMEDAADAIERMSWNRDRIRDHQQRRLRSLLAYAIACSPFHARRLVGVDPATFELEDLASLPTMTKSEMMRHFDDVVTDRRITRAAVDARLASTTSELSYLHDEYVVMASGGSSGERGVFVYDLDAAREFVLAIVRPTMAKLTAFGVTPENPVAGAVVAAGTTLHGTAFVAAVAGHGGPVRLTAIPATLPLGEIVRRLEEVQPLVLVGYPTLLARLAVEKVAGRLAIAPLGVSSTSEPLTAEARRSIEGAFGVPMTNTFGSTEGLCGVGAPGEEAICFAEDTCILELVDERGAPVAPGTASAKVLVTNVSNLAQPLVRYELTDRFTEVAGEWPDGHLRAVVEGRNDDVLEFEGAQVHPLTIRSVLVKVSAITEYQVQHDRRGIRVLAVAPDGLDTGELERTLRDSLAAAGVSDPVVDAAVVDRIERDPLTGKARRFVPVT